jgi:MFS family permease
MAPTQTPAPTAYSAGTLTYDRAGLARLFTVLLTGDLVFTLVDQLEPRVLPIILRQHGASDTEIAVIVSSITSLMQLLVMPVVSYRSDRLRSRWGRRIPYLFWATPFVSITLALTPFAPDMAAALGQQESFLRLSQALHLQPVILCFGLITVLYRFSISITSPMFFSLFRDVVPMTHMGRFLALFRIVGGLGTFVITYWLVGLAETHAKPIFVGLALLNLVGFLLLCATVKEGEYPPVVEPDEKEPALGVWAGFRRFVVQSYSQPIYWWTYVARTCIFGAVSLSAFLVFFPQRELGIPFDQVGRLMSWSSLLWLLVAFPLGRAIDRTGAIPILGRALAITAIGYMLTFFCVTGAHSYLVLTVLTGLSGWAVMLAQTALAQEIFHRERFAQLGSANVLVQSLVISLILSPGVGYLLGVIGDARWHLSVPGIGELQAGGYRGVNLVLAGLYACAWGALFRVRQLWRRFGGPDNYQAPR